MICRKGHHLGSVNTPAKVSGQCNMLSFIMHCMHCMDCSYYKMEKKSDKFSHLSSQYHFVPVAIETFGAMGPAAASLIKELGSRGSHETSEEKFAL